MRIEKQKEREAQIAAKTARDLEQKEDITSEMIKGFGAQSSSEEVDKQS